MISKKVQKEINDLPKSELRSLFEFAKHEYIQCSSWAHAELKRLGLIEKVGITGNSEFSKFRLTENGIIATGVIKKVGE